MIPAFICGPFRAPTQWGIAENVRRAERIHLAACRLGFASVCPHANTAHFQGECSDEFWLRMTSGMLDMVAHHGGPLICLPGAWRTSSGSRGELHRAETKHAIRFEANVISDDPNDLLRALAIGYSGKDSLGNDSWSPGFSNGYTISLEEWLGDEGRRERLAA